jgi:hypothetical protein
MVIDRVCSSLERSAAGVGYCYIASAGWRAALAKWPDLGEHGARALMGAVFFLRVVAPAFVNPDGFDLLPAGHVISPEGRRMMSQCARLLQCFANRTRVSDADGKAHLRPLDDVMAEMRDRYHASLRRAFASLPLEEIVANPFIPAEASISVVPVEDALAILEAARDPSRAGSVVPASALPAEDAIIPQLEGSGEQQSRAGPTKKSAPKQPVADSPATTVTASSAASTATAAAGGGGGAAAAAAAAAAATAAVSATHAAGGGSNPTSSTPVAALSSSGTTGADQPGGAQGAPAEPTPRFRLRRAETVCAGRDLRATASSPSLNPPPPVSPSAEAPSTFRSRVFRSSSVSKTRSICTGGGKSRIASAPISSSGGLAMPAPEPQLQKPSGPCIFVRRVVPFAEATAPAPGEPLPMPPLVAIDAQGDGSVEGSESYASPGLYATTP